MKNLCVLTYLYLESTLYNNVDFLTVVGGKLNILIVVAALYGMNVKRLCNSVFEGCGKVIVGHTVCVLDNLSLALSCHRIGCKCGR